MKPKVQDIHKLALEIQNASNCGNKKRLEQVLDKMIEACNSIKQELEEKKKLSQDIQLQHINSLTFMFKPVLKKNYYEGSYLEEFSSNRTSELKESKALDNHNKFWQTHEILRGNIFGSLPKELVPKESVSKLLRYGWDEVEVDIYEIVKKNCSIKEAVEFCELKFYQFLIVKEKSTEAELILHYKV